MDNPQPTRRRWFQFGTGTMLLVVSLVAIWLAWQVGIVRERQAVIDFIRERGGAVVAAKDWQPPSAYAPIGTVTPAVRPQATIPFWRRWMGDEPMANVFLPVGTAQADVERATAAFPEAEQRPFAPPGIESNARPKRD